MGGLPKIAKKVAPIIRMLASNQDGDVLNAARALDRVLKSAGADFHALADHVAGMGELPQTATARAPTRLQARHGRSNRRGVEA